MAKVPALEAVATIIKALRAKGPMASAELRKEAGVSTRSFYRALSALKEAGVVSEEGGTYYWYEHLKTVEFSSQFEAEQALKHSRNLAAGLKALVGNHRLTVDPEGSLVAMYEYATLAQDHLRTGYHGIFEALQKAECLQKSISEDQLKFRGDLEAKIVSSLPQVQEPRVLAGDILYDMKETLRGHQPYYSIALRVEGEVVKSGSSTVAKKEMFETLRSFIEKEKMSKENLQRCKAIVEMENAYYELTRRLEKEIKNLVMQVLNGTPLRGSCDYCPKIKVKKE